MVFVCEVGDDVDYELLALKAFIRLPAVVARVEGVV